MGGGQNLDSKKPHDTSLTTRFTTNREQNTLLNRFKDIFRDKNIAHLAFLIGFFRISGFVHLHRLIQEYERFESIRILVGLDVDCLLYTLQAQGLDKAYQDERFRELFANTQRGFIQEERDYSLEIEDSINALKSALESNKIEIRIVREKNVHAKFYIFHSAPMPSSAGGTRYSGSLIVGSSNLSENGLERNYEFNLESNQSDDIFYALQEFDYLWENSVPLSPEDIQSATKHTYLELRSPKELYYKLLLCHFGESFLTIDSSIKDLFRDYKPYDYQIHAIQEGLEKLKRYNGFFLSDVVGLGKTLIASIIAKKLQIDSAIEGKILIVCPPTLKKSWERHFDDLGISRHKVSTHDSLHKILSTKDEYELIIVDESHRFRNAKNQKYQHLMNIARGKKVILLSATPQNNAPRDIQNQINLFMPEYSVIEGIENLDKFFSKIQKEYERIKNELKVLANEREKNTIDQKRYEQKSQELQEALKKNSEVLRQKLLRYVMIRRTRADIEEVYAQDMEKQKLSFPKVSAPQDLDYDLDSRTHNLATQTLLFLAQQKNTIGQFAYARYLIYPNLTQKGKEKFRQKYGSGSDSAFYERSASQLKDFIQKMLFKRFDSSMEAFKSTLKNQIRSYSALITGFENNKIIIPKNYNNREKLYEVIKSTESDDNDNALQEFLEKHEDDVISLAQEDFEPDFYKKIESDRKALKVLLAQWEDIDGDPKIEKLLEFLESKKEHKIVLFTEAATTAEYVRAQLEHNGYGQCLCVNSHNRDELEARIRENFDANYPKERQKDNYQLIISTDTLAEGVNLHRADIIINYDTPYNATRLMQRIGRINRIGTSFERIYIYNFKPTHLTDKIINLINISLQKLQSFHYAFGEDSAIYDEREEVGSQRLYETALREIEEERPSPEAKHQSALKKLYKEDRKKFEHIKELPSKARTIIQSLDSEGLDSENIDSKNTRSAQSSAIEGAQSYAYIKQSKDTSTQEAHYPYHITPRSAHDSLFDTSDLSAQECDFYAMADFLEAHIKAPICRNRAALETHHAHINAALVKHTESSHTATRPEPLATPQFKPNDTRALAKIRDLPKELITDEQKALIIDSIKLGNAMLVNRINTIKLQDISAQDIEAIISDFSLRATESSHTTQTSLDSINFTQPQIQLSITCIPVPRVGGADSTHSISNLHNPTTKGA